MEAAPPALIFLGDFLAIDGLGIGDSKAICSAQESLALATPTFERKDEVEDKVQVESFLRTFVGLTQPA